MQLPAAVLWDMDGTVVDTEVYWMGAERELAAAHSAEWTEEDALHLVGWGLPDAATYIRERIGSDLTPAQIVDYLSQRVIAGLEKEMPWRPGVRELVEEFHALGVPQALVTMSYAAVARPVIEELGLQASVTGDTVEHAKPHPEPYRRAATLLGVDVTQCLAIEDSTTGATSANAAGCFVVAVPNVASVQPAPNRHILDTLAGATATGLWALNT